MLTPSSALTVDASSTTILLMRFQTAGRLTGESLLISLSLYPYTPVLAFGALMRLNSRINSLRPRSNCRYSAYRVFAVRETLKVCVLICLLVLFQLIDASYRSSPSFQTSAVIVLCSVLLGLAVFIGIILVWK